MVKHIFNSLSKTLNSIVFSEALDLLKRLLFCTFHSCVYNQRDCGCWKGGVGFSFFSVEFLVLFLAETYPCCVTSYSVGKWESSRKTKKMLYMHDVAGWLPELLIRLLYKPTLFLKALTSTWLVPIEPIPRWDCNDLFAISSPSRTLTFRCFILYVQPWCLVLCDSLDGQHVSWDMGHN